MRGKMILIANARLCRESRPGVLSSATAVRLGGRGMHLSRCGRVSGLGLLVVCLSCVSNPVGPVASRLHYRLAFEFGRVESMSERRIAVREFWCTRPTIEKRRQYLSKGR